MKRWLLDTGPLVAYLDRSDPQHSLVAERLNGFTGHFCTTSPVITEAMYFLSEDSRGPISLLEFIVSSSTKIYDATSLADLREAVTLMTTYSDVPMDYADATLVLLADRLKLNQICTLDRRGFSAYRSSAGKSFRLVLDL